MSKFPMSMAQGSQERKGDHEKFVLNTPSTAPADQVIFQLCIFLQLNETRENENTLRLMSGSCHIRRVEIVIELGIFVFS